MTTSTTRRRVTHRHAVVAESLVGSGKDGRLGLDELRVLGCLGKSTKVLLREVHNLLVINSTGSGNDKSVGSVVGVDVVLQVSLGQVLDVLVRAENGAAETSAKEGRAVQLVQDDLLVLLVHLLGLAKNHIALAGDGSLVQLGVLQNVRQDLDSLGHIVLEDAGVIHGLFSGGIGIEVAADILDLNLQLLLRSVLGSLEGHVLQEVGGAVVLLSFISAASINPHTNGGGFAMGGFRCDANTVVQQSELSDRAIGKKSGICGEISSLTSSLAGYTNKQNS
jgi:hypothetical protein